MLRSGGEVSARKFNAKLVSVVCAAVTSLQQAIPSAKWLDDHHRLVVLAAEFEGRVPASLLSAAHEVLQLSDILAVH